MTNPTHSPSISGSASGTSVECACICSARGRSRPRATLVTSRSDDSRTALLALSAVRCNPDLKATYDRLRAKGKPFKLALTAVMRKLLILANALIRDDRTWAPAKPK